MPLRCTIHSSEVSISCARSSLLTTRSGTWNAVAMNSVRGIAVPCGRKVIGQDFAPGPPKQGSHGSRSHPRAIRRRAGRAPPPRCPQERADRCQTGRRRGRLRAAPHLRRGHGAERAVRLERPHRCERRREPRVARVRRPGEGYPHPSRLLDAQTHRRTGAQAHRHTNAVGATNEPDRWSLGIRGARLRGRARRSPKTRVQLRRLHRAEGRERSAALSRRPVGRLRRDRILPQGQSRDGPHLARGARDRTDARLWTGLLWRHWDDWRVGKRQHLFRVTLAGDAVKDITPFDHDVPTIATSGDGDVAVSPDGNEIAFAMHGDSTVADNTNVDIYLASPDGSGMHALTPSRGADNTPRYSPDGRWLGYLSMERPGFEADRVRLMLVGRKDGKTDGGNVVEATRGWALSVGSYTWCPDSKCVYAVVEERGRDNLYRIDVPSFRRSVVVGNSGLNTNPSLSPDGKTVVYLHQSNTQPAEVWVSERQLTHHTDSSLAALDLKPLEPYGFVGALGDSVFGWILKPPGFDPARRYPLVYLVHGGPQGAWDDNWHARWNYQMFAARGYVVAAVNFHGSTGYGQKFTDAISQHWGDYPFEDVMKGVDVIARLPYVDSTRMGAAGASYGGYMIYWIAGHTNRFKVLVSHDGVFNTASMAGSTEELWFTDWEFGGPVYKTRALYEKWSPLNHVSDWKTPLLVVHSQLDYRVDLSEGYQAFTAAKRMGLDAKFLYFPDEGHWVLRPRNRRIWWGTVLDWLEVHLNESPHP